MFSRFGELVQTMEPPWFELHKLVVLVQLKERNWPITRGIRPNMSRQINSVTGGRRRPASIYVRGFVSSPPTYGPNGRLGPMFGGLFAVRSWLWPGKRLMRSKIRAPRAMMAATTSGGAYLELVIKSTLTATRSAPHCTTDPLVVGWGAIWLNKTERPILIRGEVPSRAEFVTAATSMSPPLHWERNHYNPLANPFGNGEGLDKRAEEATFFSSGRRTARREA